MAPKISTEVTRRFVSNDNIEIAVFEQGNPKGETLLLVHGWPDTHELWDHVAPHLLEKYRVVSFDNRGAGESTIPTKVDDFRIEELATDVFAVIDAVSPRKPVHLLAHDWGGVVGWEVVSTPGADKRVASFTCVSGPNLDLLGQLVRKCLSNPTPSNLAKIGTQLLASSYTFAFMVPGLSEPALKFLSGRWPAFIGLFDGFDTTSVTTAPTLRNDMLVNQKLYRANIRSRLWSPDLRRVSVPVQLIVGTGDRAVRPLVYEDVESITGILVRREIDSGHWSPISHAETLAEFTTGFVDSLATKRSSTVTP